MRPTSESGPVTENREPQISHRPSPWQLFAPPSCQGLGLTATEETEMSIVEHKYTVQGMPYLIFKTDKGHLCGYVGVSANHPLYEKLSDDYILVSDHRKNRPFSVGRICVISLLIQSPEKLEQNKLLMSLAFDVHGGVNYTGLCEFAFDETDFWWIGFDCNHSGDAQTPDSETGVYRDRDYVLGECESLAYQLFSYGDTT